MIRKQLYITPDQQGKLRRLVARRGCTEAEVIRNGLDALPDPEGTFEERLRSAGLLVESPVYPDLPKGAEAAALRREYEAWLDTQTEPLGLSEAVMEDRAGR